MFVRSLYSSCPLEQYFLWCKELFLSEFVEWIRKHCCLSWEFTMPYTAWCTKPRHFPLPLKVLSHLAPFLSPPLSWHPLLLSHCLGLWFLFFGDVASVWNACQHYALCCWKLSQVLEVKLKSLYFQEIFSCSSCLFTLNCSYFFLCNFFLTILITCPLTPRTIANI